MSKKQSSVRKGAQQLFYTEAFKQKIVEEVLSGKLNKRQASLLYGIKGNATILYWIKQSQGLKGYDKKEIAIANFAEMKQNIHDKKLEEENKELKELLRVAELRADLWQHAIEIAEKKFNIDILKKFGVQPLTPSKSKDPKEKVTEMCTLFGVTKQAYYKHLKVAELETAKEEIIVGLIQKKRIVWKRGSGRNLHQSLKKEMQEHEIKIGRDKFFDVLRNNNLFIKSKRFRAKTTCSYHHFNKYSNLIESLIPQAANEVWVSDITYLWLKEKDKFCYLSLITDMYSRKIVGHCVYEDLSVRGCLAALREALKNLDKNNDLNLIHHSDRGVQYCCHAYVNLLQKKQIKISMTQTGDPLENAIAERINKTIKEEFTNDKQINFSNIDIAKTEIKKFINFYNKERPHRSIEWLTPDDAHKRQGELKRVWKSYHRKKLEWGDLVKA